MSLKKILIVEDDADNRELLTEIIGACSPEYTSSSAKDGEDAINKLENNEYDLVFMDVAMPKKNGYEIIRHVRKTQNCASIPVVALTAHAMKGVKEKVLESGFNEYLAKPCSLGDLKQVIGKYLDNKKKVLLGE